MKTLSAKHTKAMQKFIRDFMLEQFLLIYYFILSDFSVKKQNY
jgi:hypothetical protein